MANKDSHIEINSLICRVCLTNSSTAHSLTDFIITENRMEIADLLKRVTNIDIIMNDMDGMPSRICEACTEKLVNAYEFISEVEKTEKLLRRCMEGNIFVMIEETKIEPECQSEFLEMQTTDLLENSSNSSEIEILDEELENYVIGDVQTETITMQIKQESEPIENNDSMHLSVNGAFELKSNMEGKQNLHTNKDLSAETKSNDVLVQRINLRPTTLRYECPKCSRMFAKQATLQRHIEAAHTIVAPDKIQLPEFSPRFVCPHCPRILARKDNLFRHMQAMHPNEAEEWAREEGRANKPKNRYKRGLCPYCGQSFSQASLIIHIRRHTGEFPYQCNECEKAFPRRQDLIIHQRKHTGEKPYICGACGKSFIRPNKLTRHMRIHTGSRPYKCDKCEKSFSQSNDLKIHIRRHTGEKPYKCGICNEAFICGSALTAHRKAKKHEEPEENLPDPFAAIRVNNRNKRTARADQTALE